MTWAARIIVTAAIIAYVAILFWLWTDIAHAHPAPHKKPISAMTLKERESFLYQAVKYHRYVSRHGSPKHAAWHRKALRWTLPNLYKAQRALWWADARARNIAAAEHIARQGGDPWPNCPDPLRDGASWDATKACESPGYSWAVDPPGYFCGPLQIDPAFWGSVIRRYGVPC